MAGLLDIFGTSGQNTLGLLGGDVGSTRDDAQAQALYALAGSLLSGGPTGLSIVKGLQQGQQAYKQAMRGAMEEQLQGVQMQEYLRKRKMEEEALARQQMIDRAVAGAYKPGVAAQPAQEVYGEDIMGQRVGEGVIPAVAAQAPRLDLQSITPALMASREGRASLAELAKIIPEVRKAGLMPGAVQENPFTLFVADPTVPAPLRAMAQQYQKSYASGQLDQETADKRFAELASRVQSAQQFQQTQAGLEAQRAQTNALASGNQAISQNLAGLREAEIAQRVQQREEERQKPVTEAKEAINLINQAEKLLPQATGSLIGTGVDILAGSVGKSTPGAEASAKLKAIEGALVAKMPKMSGPQSDKDVLLYRQMAAQVGDSKLPPETRQAALGTLREIQERYAKVPEGSTKPSQPTSPFKFSAEKENRYQQWLKQQEGK